MSVCGERIHRQWGGVWGTVRGLGVEGGGVETTCEGRYLDGVDVSLSDNKLLDAEEFCEPRPLVDRSQCHCLIRVQTLTKF